MNNYARTLCVLLGVALVLTVGLASATSAEPLYGKPIHAPEPTVEPASTGEHSPDTGSSAGSDTAGDSKTATNQTNLGHHTVPGGTSNVSTTQMSADVKNRLQANQLQFCEQQSSTISDIMDRSSTRAKNQVTLFSGVATKVENFYTSKGKTIATYDTLVAAVNSAEVQANTGLATLQSSGGFSCGGNNPGGIVSTYRANLNTIQTDIKNLRTASRNLIIAVAQAEGYTLSKSAIEGSQQ